MSEGFNITRRRFLQASAMCAAGAAAGPMATSAFAKDVVLYGDSAFQLPVGNEPRALPIPHFPSRLHAFIWRNWQLVPIDRLATVVRATRSDILQLGRELGLERPPRITADQRRRSYITVIRRNWHLLPYSQLLELLGWTSQQMLDALRYDDGLFWKLGSLKPKCEPLLFAPRTAEQKARAAEIVKLVHEHFPSGLGPTKEPLFKFVADLSKPIESPHQTQRSHFTPRFCYSYFSLYGDPLLDDAADPYPPGYLSRLADSGVDGVWLNIVLSKLAPFPWDSAQSEKHEQRLANLRALVARARKKGIGVFLYLNEPRVQPLSFFRDHPALKGIDATQPWEKGSATLCTSAPEVQEYLVSSVAHICRAVPDLAGFFTITASEALTNCWSHHAGAGCPRCGKRRPAEVIAEVNRLYYEGIQQAGSKSALIVWDWGWDDTWAEDIINGLPREASFMSVSEWNVPIDRGGVKSLIGEYSISAVGPGPRATRHWGMARKRGLRTIAKIQAGNTWELSATPYIPAVQNVAQHAANLRGVGVDGLMLGWSLGGYPSPNLEVVAELGREEKLTPEAAMERVAARRFGPVLGSAVTTAWKEFSVAFSEFPFGGGIYHHPTQSGPSNLLWAEPTGYRSGAVGLPYDDLASWRGQYPENIFIQQFEKVATGFEGAFAKLKAAVEKATHQLRESEREAIRGELSVAEAATVHFRSTVNQCRFVQARNRLAAAKDRASADRQIGVVEEVLKSEITLARRLYDIQSADSRIGFEATNHYYYVPLDLAEKIVNCEYLLREWLPAVGRK